MLRSYQKELVNLALSSQKNVLMQADTGSGKTNVLAEITKKSKYVLCIAHRNILIKQLSTTLAKFKIKHNVLATKHTQRQCILAHRKQGNEFYSATSNRHVCAIDSLLSHHRRTKLTLDTTKPWVIIVDEAHHMVSQNKWGKLTKIFPNARIVGATATPCRLDQKSLSRKKGGVFDELIQASELKQNSLATLIDMGFISPFKCYSLPEHVSTGNLTKYDGDYTYKSLCTETNKVKYKMAGDAVKYYKKLAEDKQALAFCVSIKIAHETAEYFKKNGISAAAIHSKLTSVESARIFDLFERKQIKVLCNVDMIGEGVDVPAIEALLMLRKTASFGLYRQWVGRSLRPEKNKDYAILLDFVGNIRTHDLPDKHIDWSLENPPIAKKSNLYPCPNCHHLNLAWSDKCEDCGEILRSESLQESKESHVEYVDLGLVEIHKRKADEKKRQNRRAWEHENIINESELNYFSGGGFLGKLVTTLRVMCIEHLKEHISTAECNVFLMNTKNQSFWISEFTNNDIKKNDPIKTIKVYKKWLKSN